MNFHRNSEARAFATTRRVRPDLTQDGRQALDLKTNSTHDIPGPSRAVNDRNHTDYSKNPHAMLLDVIGEALTRYISEHRCRIYRLAEVIGISRNSVRNLMGELEYKRIPHARTLEKLKKLDLGKEAIVAIEFLLDLEAMHARTDSRMDH